MIAEDPVALLGGDLSGLGDVDKTAILKSLLDAVEKKRVTDSIYKHSEIYAKLKHPRPGGRTAAVRRRRRVEPNHPPARLARRRKM
ncbi:hypothetical protein MTX20_00890 (plasmid) [Bradyrhizobium sp. ISRA435]|nr:hypothetical protein MTX20_00890 [Bradyrhizobium sp. ISRA435]